MTVSHFEINGSPPIAGAARGKAADRPVVGGGFGMTQADVRMGFQVGTVSGSDVDLEHSIFTLGAMFPRSRPKCLRCAVFCRRLAAALVAAATCAVSARSDPATPRPGWLREPAARHIRLTCPRFIESLR